jgi:hypothetical protein
VDEGSTPPVPDEDDPAIMEATAPSDGEGGRTYKTQLSELFLSPPVQTLIPCSLEYPSTRPDCGGGPNDPPTPVWGRFTRRAPTEIPSC